MLYGVQVAKCFDILETLNVADERMYNNKKVRLHEVRVLI